MSKQLKTVNVADVYTAWRTQYAKAKLKRIVLPGYLSWNSETETWEPQAEARWYECGEPLAAINRLCTKFIGHGGEHGTRDEVDRP